jgi:hypothetical protein
MSERFEIKRFNLFETITSVTTCGRLDLRKIIFCLIFLHFYLLNVSYNKHVLSVYLPFGIKKPIAAAFFLEHSTNASEEFPEIFNILWKHYRFCEVFTVSGK